VGQHRNTFNGTPHTLALSLMHTPHLHRLLCALKGQASDVRVKKIMASCLKSVEKFLPSQIDLPGAGAKGGGLGGSGVAIMNAEMKKVLLPFSPSLSCCQAANFVALSWFLTLEFS